MNPTNTASSSNRKSSIHYLWSFSSASVVGNLFKHIKASVTQLALAMNCAKTVPEHNLPIVQTLHRNLQTCSDTVAVAKALEVLIGSDTASSPHSTFLSPVEINSTVKAFAGYVGYDCALSRFHLLIKQSSPPYRPPTALEIHATLKSLGNNSHQRIQDIARASLGDLVENILEGSAYSARCGRLPPSYMQFTRNCGPLAVALLKALSDNSAEGCVIATNTNLNIEQLIDLAQMLVAYTKTLPKNTLQRANAYRFAQHIQGKVTLAREISRLESTPFTRVARSPQATCSDVDVMRAALKNNGLCLRFASPTLRSQHDLVMVAVQNYGFSLQFASVELRNTPDIVMAAVQNRGVALKYASAELKNSVEIVIKAVQNNGLALRFASARIRSDRGVVMAAVQQNGLALRYTGLELQNTLSILIAAVRQDSRAIQFARGNLQDIEM